jgi:DNA-binding transcriptional ArsR family regulator
MEHHRENLDDVFQALADPTRRAVLARLSGGPASVTELSEPFEMALPSFLKHIRYLEGSGLITTRKSGRVRTCALQDAAFRAAEHWLSDQRALWESRNDRLEQFVMTQQGKA